MFVDMLQVEDEYCQRDFLLVFHFLPVSYLSSILISSHVSFRFMYSADDVVKLID